MQAIELSVGEQGNIVLPKTLRQELAIHASSYLIATIENGRLILEPKKQLWKSIHAACRHIPKETDLAQELIEERRASARRENI